MKLQSMIVPPLLLLTVVALRASDNASLPDANAVMTTMLQRDVQRRAALEGYRGMRRYILENSRMQKHAEVLAQVESDTDGTKHFTVVDEEGWKAANKHVFRKMIETEGEASRPEVAVRTCLCPENYAFHTVGSEAVDGRPAFVIEIAPRRREERLFAGRIWVDAEDYALIRAEGKPSKNPSFWIHSVHFVHTYQKAGPFWFPSTTESISEVRIFGATKVTINYFNYSPKSQQLRQTAGVQPQLSATR